MTTVHKCNTCNEDLFTEIQSWDKTLFVCQETKCKHHNIEQVVKFNEPPKNSYKVADTEKEDTERKWTCKWRIIVILANFIIWGVVLKWVL